jgi:RNA polymerase sigma-70 factor, ECF subfamily
LRHKLPQLVAGSDSLQLGFLGEFGPQDVHAVLLRLRALCLIPLVLFAHRGFLAKEAARLLDVPLGTVLARLHRGRKLFEKQLWEHAEEAGLQTKDAR